MKKIQPGSIDAVLASGRHEKKHVPGGAEYDPGDEFDTNHIHIGEEGASDGAQRGSEIFPDVATYDGVVAAVSPLVRTLETAGHLFRGGNVVGVSYRPENMSPEEEGNVVTLDDKVYVVEDPEMGLAIDDVQWGHDELPEFKGNLAGYVETVLSECFSRNNEDKPVMANHASTTLDMTAKGIRYLQDQHDPDNDKALGAMAQIAHATITDAWKASFTEGLELKDDGIYLKDNYMSDFGPTQQGEIYEGHALDLGTDNPRVRFLIDDAHGDEQEIVRDLSDIERMRNEMAGYRDPSYSESVIVNKV